MRTRPDVVVHGHPVRRIVQELHGQRQCEELVLELLTLAEVTEYVRCRVDDRPDLETLSEALYGQSEGNALFLVSFIDALSLGVEADEQAAVVTLSSLPPQIPMNLRHVVLRQVEE